MIEANFYGNCKKKAFEVSGHSGFAVAGADIVCAAVSSAVQLTANGISEVVKANAEIEVLENKISLSLPENSPAVAYLFIESLYLQLCLLSEDYGKYIKVTVTEV